MKRRTQIPSCSSKTSIKNRPRAISAHASPDDTFKSTKEDKRRIKHSTLISRIEKANSKVKKRRRPSKKLFTNLKSLANALPDETSEGGGPAAISDFRIRHTSLKNKPGSMKKKEKLEKMEMDRFGKNMAQMARVTNDERPPNPTDVDAQVTEDVNGASKKWAALRTFIQSTLDRDVVSKPC